MSPRMQASLCTVLPSLRLIQTAQLRILQPFPLLMKTKGERANWNEQKLYQKVKHKIPSTYPVVKGEMGSLEN